MSKTAAGEVQNDKKQDQTESDDPKYFHPAWRARIVTVGVWIERCVSHARVFLSRIERVTIPVMSNDRKKACLVAIYPSISRHVGAN